MFSGLGRLFHRGDNEANKERRDRIGGALNFLKFAELKKAQGQDTTDFYVKSDDTTFLIQPITKAAHKWVEEHISIDVQHRGSAIVLESVVEFSLDIHKIGLTETYLIELAAAEEGDAKSQLELALDIPERSLNLNKGNS